MLKIIQGFTWRNGLFAVKTFVAAMLALYIALRLNLLQPSWSVTTVFIVSQPLAGMVLAKSAYRVLGTLIGAVMSLVFVALFSNTPELFLLVLGLWIGAGTFVSIYLGDAPQAYMGMLAGYSAAIIGLPAALAPDTAFDFAIARCLEIMLGIACGSLMHHVVIPERAGDALRNVLDTTLPAMARWAEDALRGQQSEAKRLADQRQIISTVVTLDSLRVFAAFDTPAIKAADLMIRQFEGKLFSLLALLLSIHDRFALLRRSQPSTADALRPLLERAAAHIAGSAKATTPEHSRQESTQEFALVTQIDAQLPPAHELRRSPDAFLVRSVLLRLRDVLAMWDEAVWIRTHIAAGIDPPDTDAAPTFHRNRDVKFALVGGAISAMAVLIAGVFWIFTAWPNGPAAVTFAGIICALLGARDDPAAVSAAFLKMSVVGAIVAGFYLFVVLPPLSTFPALMMALAPFYLVCGLFLTVRSAIPLVMAMIFVAGALMGISNNMDYDFTAFANGFVSYIVGIGIAAAALGLLRPIGTEWAVQRLTRSLMADLARISGASMPEQRSAFESRMFDRINELLMRLDPTVDEQRAAMQSRLASLRVGLNILALQTVRPLLPRVAAAPVEGVLAALADHFRRVARHGRACAPLALLKAARDRILSLEDDALLTRTAEALYGIETTLRQHPDFFGLTVLPLPTASVQSVTA